MTPRFHDASGWTAQITGTFGGAILPHAPPNTCSCGGDQTYNQCYVSRNDCSPGYYPVCKGGSYNCGCTCEPG